jgi:hypothetical protein
VVVGGTATLVDWPTVTGGYTCVTVLITMVVTVLMCSEYFIEREVTSLTDRLVSVMVVVYFFSMTDVPVHGVDVMSVQFLRTKVTVYGTEIVLAGRVDMSWTVEREVTTLTDRLVSVTVVV